MFEIAIAGYPCISALLGLIIKGNVHAKARSSFLSPWCSERAWSLLKNFQELPKSGLEHRVPMSTDKIVVGIWLQVAGFSPIWQRHVAIFLRT